jgi:ABC-type nickel/cobalt efflux system permease component RcnA
MNEFAQMLQQGNSSVWWFIPSAIALGALHGLEPGHSKTMMAAFIIAVRGTVGQAVLLGLAATLSHTAIVWAVAMGGLYFGGQWDAANSEPYLQLISAALIAATALWMAYRTWLQGLPQAHDHSHGHSHDHRHGHHQGAIGIHSDHVHGHNEGHDHAHQHGDQHGHSHDHGHGQGAAHSHGHGAAHTHSTSTADAEPGMDAHARAHAREIEQRFASGHATNGQIVVFGLTGGLIPCPASITVLLLCLQLKQVALGATLVLSFSVGLALTMVASGVLAAWSVGQATKRWSGFGHWAAKAPYISTVLMLLLALWMAGEGWHGLQAVAA